MPYIVFQWQDNSLIEDGHRVYRSSEPMNPNALPSPVATLGANVEQYVDTTFTDESPLAEMLYYRVSSYEGSQNLVSEELSLPNPGNVLYPDSPTWLFGNEEYGFANTLGIDTLFTDTSGTTPVEEYGDAIALATNLADDGPDMVQATAAARPVYGRMPVVRVRNLFPARSDDRAVTNGGQFGAGASFQINTYDGYDSLVAVTGDLTGRQYAVGAPGIWYAIRFQARRLAGTGWFRDPGISSTALRKSDYLVYSVGVGSDDWVDCVLIGTPPDGTRINYILAWDSEIGLEIALRNIQVELVEPNTTEPTAYQSVDAGPYDITEPGIPSVDISYLDGADDAFPWTLGAGTYYLFIAGEKGCYFDTVEHAGGEFVVGPTTWTGGPPDALADLIGNRHVILPVLRDEPFTEFEKAQLVAYAVARGCPGEVTP